MNSSYEDSQTLPLPQGKQRIMSTGSIRLDAALGTGGIPAGCLAEISGPQSSGKTTLCNHIVAEAQRVNALCAYFDIDQTWDPCYARRCGLDPGRLVVCNTVDISPLLDVLSILVKTAALNVIILDSISSVNISSNNHRNCQGEPSDTLDQHIARILRMVSHTLKNSQTRIIFTRLSLPSNRPIYHALSSHFSRLALYLHASIRIRLSTLKMLHDEGTYYGRRVRAHIIKNSFHPCQQFADLDIMYRNGIAQTVELFDLGVQLSLVTHGKHGYCYNDNLLGFDTLEVQDFLENNPDLASDLDLSIRRKLFQGHPEPGIK